MLFLNVLFDTHMKFVLIYKISKINDNKHHWINFVLRSVCRYIYCVQTYRLNFDPTAYPTVFSRFRYPEGKDRCQRSEATTDDYFRLPSGAQSAGGFFRPVDGWGQLCTSQPHPQPYPQPYKHTRLHTEL